MTQSTKKFYTTPVGTVQPYAYIQRPDTEYNDRGEYRIKLAIPSDKAQKVIDLIEKTHEANMEKVRAEAKKKGKRAPKECDMPFYEDDNGNVIFTFKMYGSFDDNGTRKELTLRVYDSAGKRIENVPNISGGSEGRVEFSLFAFASAAVGCGVKLQLSKFQLLKLVEYKAGGNDTFGGDDDELEGYEGGYVHQEKPRDEFGNGSEDFEGEPEEAPEDDEEF